MEKKELIGQKYYKYVGDTLYMFRLMKVKNENAFVVKDENSGITVTLTRDQLNSYTKLATDAMVVFSIVKLQDDIPDVIVSLWKTKDLGKDPLPYAVCRQNVFDVYSNSIVNKVSDKMIIGCSISKDTCPDNVPFEMLVACNDVDKKTRNLVGVYMDDDLDTIMQFVKPAPYDEVLKLLHSGFDQERTEGSVTSLYDLLKSNAFIHELYRAFNIVPVNFEYSEMYVKEFTMAVEDIIKKQMLDPVWVKYDRDIDLSKIKEEYLLVRDSKGIVYIVSYVPGEYVNRPYYAMGDTSEVDALLK